MNNIVGSQFKTSFGTYYIEKLLGKGKSGFSYLAENNGKKFTLKLMHEEPCPYYDFKENKTKLEIKAYKKLSKHKISIPKLLEHDIEKNYLIKEFIDGPTATEVLISEKINDYHIIQLFEIANKLKRVNLNIDFFPSNFVIRNDQIYYIDYEINDYTFEWSLENWGIYYWANSVGFKKFIESGNAEFINSDLNKGIPIKDKFKFIVDNWKHKYSNG